VEIALTADVAVAQGLVVGRLVEESAIKTVLEDERIEATERALIRMARRQAASMRALS